jgi:enoyl-CoA hydratase/carnithine racemase
MSDVSLPVSPSHSLEVDDSHGVRVLTLTRTEALNAFNVAMFTAVREALADAAQRDDISCVAITATGRAFSAGSDLGGEDDSSTPPRGPDPYEAFIAQIESFPKPLVAAVNGLAVGIGTSLLGHCDLVLAGRSARFRLPFTSLGLVPEAGSTVTLPALMGRQPSTYAFLTSSWISAQEAFESGLVWRLTSDEDLLPATLEVCTQIAAQPLESLVSTKRLLLRARLPAARAARAHEEPEFRRLLARPAHREALAAFRERREPDFRSLQGPQPG